MRRPGDKRFDLVLSAKERAVVNRLAGPQGPQNFLKRLVNDHIRRFGLPEVALALRGRGRPAGQVAATPRHYARFREVPAHRNAGTTAGDAGVEFGQGYFRKTGGD